MVDTSHPNGAPTPRASASPTHPGRPASLRSMNDRAALKLLIDNGPMTRQQLCDGTSLSGPTVSQVVARLTDADLIEEAGYASGSRGPNAVVYGARTDTNRGVALHVRPGRIIAQVVDASNSDYPVAEVHLSGKDRTARTDIIAAIDAATQAANLTPDVVTATCVAVPGAVSITKDTLRFVSSLQGWPRRSVRTQLEAQLGLTVLIDNDANLAAVAESRQGTGLSDFALLWQGEGLGVAPVTDGKVIRGSAGGAGEIGYLPVTLTAAGIDPTAKDLQSLVGPAAVTKLVRAHRPSVHTYEAALAALRTGAVRDQVLTELAPRVAEVLQPVLAVLDPAVVVLGGPTGAAGGKELATLVQTHLRHTTRWRTPIVATAVAAHPVLRGTALTLADHLAGVMLDQVN